VLGGSATAGTLYNQVINGDPYYTQTEWSNGDSACQAQPAPGALSASFTLASTGVPLGSALTFDPSATTSAQGYTSVTWNFGDGSPPSFTRISSAPAAVQHAYAVPGTYTAAMTVLDTRGNLSSVSRVLTVSVGSTAVGAPVTVTPPPVTVTIPPVTTPPVSTPPVTTTPVTVTPPPVTTPPVADEPPTAAFTVGTARPVAGARTAFDAGGSSDPDGAIVSWRWAFGDGSSGTGVAPAHAYRKPGRYAVTLTETDSSGLTAKVSHVVAIARVATITRISVKLRKGGATLVLRLSDPGILTVGGSRYSVLRAGTVTLVVHPTAAQRALLARVHHLRITLDVRFVPAVGASTSRMVGLALHD
jgi:PKD repeat protein